MAAPGLIDSHVHITFGDFTPRQNTVGYLHSYLHGGVTTSISASEVHVPGRPTDLDGVKALAVAARKCFENFKPSGMRVHAGSLILEPGLTSKDYEDVVSRVFGLQKLALALLAKRLNMLNWYRKPEKQAYLQPCTPVGRPFPVHFQ